MTLLQEREVYVAGIGMHAYQFPSATPYVHLGLTAVRQAIADAGVPFDRVQSAYVGTANLGMAAGRLMLHHLGSTGLAVAQVENASASGSAAFRLACQDVASGVSEISLAIGVDKFGKGFRAADEDGIARLSPTATIPLVMLALKARSYMQAYGLSTAQMAAVAVKNHRNASLNPYAQFRKPRSLEEVLASPKVAGDLTVQQCTPRGEGAACTLLVSGAMARRLGLDTRRLVRVTASVAMSEREADPDGDADVDMVRESTRAACEQAGIGLADLGMVELHDAFSFEELLYTEAMGLAEPGDGWKLLRDGHTELGGRIPVNASGGLLGMGHPLGPTGIGQVAEIVRQMRGEAEGRQHDRPIRHALAHMIGLGSVAFAHVLSH